MPRNTVPLFITMPPEERDRVAAFAAKVGRPMGWIARDALRAYMDAAERDAEALARVRNRLDAPTLAAAKVGRTPQPPRGRPPKGKGKVNVR